MTEPPRRPLLGELTALPRRLAYSPHDVWVYLLAAAWQRADQEEHLMPRAGFVGDELGASVIGARLARDVMRIAFLLERRYAPYPKWLGTAFGRLDCAVELVPLLGGAPLIGAVDQWSDSADVLSNAALRRSLRLVYEAMLAGVPGSGQAGRPR